MTWGILHGRRQKSPPSEVGLSGSPRAISQYLATAANAFDHAVERGVLAIDCIVRITRQVFLRGHLIGPRLAVADRRLRQQLVVRVRRWGWCGWIRGPTVCAIATEVSIRASNAIVVISFRMMDLPRWGPLTIHGSGETRQQGAQTSRFVQMFQALTGSTGISIGPGQDSPAALKGTGDGAGCCFLRAAS